MRRLYKNAQLVLAPDEVSGEGFLCDQDGVIQRIELRAGRLDFDSILEKEQKLCDEVNDCLGDYLAPGLIDIHCHGALERDTMEATFDAFDQILNFHATGGATLVVLTTVAARFEEMQSVLDAAQSYRQERKSSRLAGIHLEGPYFSPQRRGAHRLEMLRHPAQKETQVILQYAGVISRMTLAPELPGALELISNLVQRGITMSAGHSDATKQEAGAGFEAGISQVTHLYNSMSSLHSNGGQRFTGLAEAALTTPGILCEVIADARHLSPTLLRLAWLAKGWAGVVIVTDATAGAGMPEGSLFQLGGLPCRIEQGMAWTGEGKNRRLAGSTIGMIDGVRVMVEEAKVPLNEAVAMATLVPAQALGLGESRGSLAPGKRSDLLRFSPDWQVLGLWSEGAKIV